MLKKSSNTLQTTKAAAEYFTGNAWLDILVKNDNIKCNVAKVTFEPAARNHWHTHPAGQVLLATQGKGYVQKKGEPIQLLLPGDVVIILPGEEHWHGAAHDSIFTHMAIQPLSEKGEDIFWLKAVTEEEYNAYRAPD
ncbi:MAG TPA: cupin domain-containing protein [Chitinophagales bacterium]|nr:cupin domain-containing protein [Chitinophagales bacterium]